MLGKLVGNSHKGLRPQTHVHEVHHQGKGLLNNWICRSSFSPYSYLRAGVTRPLAASNGFDPLRLVGLLCFKSALIVY